jgi:hypothetical protein
MGCLIIVPLELLPSMLVWNADVPTTTRSLLKRSRASREQADLVGAFELTQRAKDLVKASKDPISEAVTAVHLADLYRELARPGPALELARQAEQMIQYQAQRRHRHNHGVISYLLALLHHELCSYSTALSYYQRARRQLEDARRYWIGVEDSGQARRCEEVIHWVGGLCANLTSPPPLGTEEIYLPVKGRNGEYTVARGRIMRYTLAEELTVDQASFRSCSVSGAAMRLGVSAHGEYFALPVLTDEWAGSETEAGDYLLIRREHQPNEEGPAVLHDADAPEGWRYGRFVRDRTGHISFRPQPKIIGGTPQPSPAVSLSTDEAMGYVVAIFKPAPTP